MFIVCAQKRFVDPRKIQKNGLPSSKKSRHPFLVKLLAWTREQLFLFVLFRKTTETHTHSPPLFSTHAQYGVCVVHDDEKEALVAIIIVIVVIIIIRTRTSVVSKKKKNKRRPTNHRLVVVVVVTDGRKKTASARDDAGGLFAAVLEREKKRVRAVFRPDVPGEVRGELRVSVGYFERRWEERC